MIDEIAAYWDLRPCNVRHSREPVGSLAYSRQVTRRKFRVEPHLWRFAEFGTWRGKDVLDLGGGIGTEALEFAKGGARVTAIDVSCHSLGIAQRRANAEGVSVEFVHGDMESYPFLGQQFDLVWAWGSLHHTPEPARALANARRWLKAGGRLCAMLYHRFSTKALRLWLRAGCPRDFDSAVALGSEAQERCPLTRTYTVRGARRLFTDAGFTVTRCEVWHIFPWRVADYVEGRYVKAWPWCMLDEYWLEGWLGWHILVEARI